ncbi:T9SS type A sorting domain-containing protein [Formosa maritima]|uniref:T9SS type A sorting domain-containing protein n=1 Tax=Formosa maritima TaxID=2592046 RepID=A0A5D0G412_9FLAO|nr:T9SS type A sorting domain-containing protein [Formosa maritima]TYA53019.1 T9SS type A sorting domain-containing protein [Formosa maritima]
MKKIYFLLFTLIATSLTFGQASDLYFSMYGEGSSNNKFLEIYNGTGAPVDLSGYSLSSCSNGCNVVNEFDFPDTLTFAPGTMLANNDVYVIAHPSADATILAMADVTFTFLSNGDDAFALTLAGATASTYTIIDMLGDLAVVDGSGWEVAGVSNATVDHTLTRKSSICDPNPTELGSFGTDASDSEWIVGPQDSGWAELGMHTGCVSDPVLTIVSPADAAIIASGTTNVDITIDVQNFDVDELPSNGGTGDGHIHWTLNGGSTTMKYDTDPISIPVVDGQSYTVFMQLVDNSHTPIVPAVNATVTFSVALPCDLQVGTITTTCDAITGGSTDTYTTTIDFTGGNTSTYTIDTEGNGTVGGDNPSSVASGTITITGVVENTNFVVTFTGDPGNSGCNFTRNINSPDCDPELVLPLYDGFTYGNGSNLSDAPNWENVSVSTDEILITSGNLSYSGLAASSGNKASFDGGGSDTAIMFAPITTGTVYASFIMRVTDLTSVSDVDGGYFAFLGNFDGRLWVVPSGATQYQVGLGYNTNSADIINADTHDLDDEVFVVMSYETTTGLMNAWINPSSTDFEGSAPAVSITIMDGGPVSSINQFALRQDSTTETGFMDVDELRLGTTWAQVTPLTLSTASYDIDGLNVYPNPVTSGFVNITSKSNEAIKVAVFDILGKQVINNTVNNNRLNVSTLNTGVYIMKLSQNGNTITKKLVVR